MDWQNSTLQQLTIQIFAKIYDCFFCLGFGHIANLIHLGTSDRKIWE